MASARDSVFSVGGRERFKGWGGIGGPGASLDIQADTDIIVHAGVEDRKRRCPAPSIRHHHHLPHLKPQHTTRPLLPLHPAHGGEHRGLTQDVTAFFVEPRADDEVGEAGLILQGDEGVPLGGGRALVDDNQPGA